MICHTGGLHERQAPVGPAVHGGRRSACMRHAPALMKHREIVRYSSRIALILAISSLVLVGCGRRDAALPEPTVTPPPPVPSRTPAPPPVPSRTPVPTATPTPTPTPPDPDPTETPTSSPATLVEERVDALLSRMTLEQKVGQLFVVFFDGTEYAEPLDRTIRELNVGGIILFTPNVGSLEDMVTLVNRAQTTASQHGAPVPLIVAVDHEGGLVNRFGDGLTRFPSNMALAATRSLDLAGAEARVMAEELGALGINMNLAPVVDVNTNPDNPVIGIRSFGSNPHRVAQFGTAVIRTFQENGIIATAKHFPGHGDAAVDSHTALPVIPHHRTRLDAVELLPFRAAIEADVAAIMTAHVAVLAVEPTPELPATLSGTILTDLLRDELRFDGLIATDSLGMGALERSGSVTDATGEAFRAGADLLMFGADAGHAPAEQYPPYEHLLTLVRNGTVSQERLDASVRRILLVKGRMGILDWQPSSPSEIPTRVRTPEHLALADRIAEQSVTLLKNDRQWLPLRPDQRTLLVYPDSQAELEPALSEYGTQIDAMPVSIDPSQQQITQVISATQNAEVIIVATADARDHPGQIALVGSMPDIPTIILALRSPYDLLAFPSQSTYVAIYGDVPASIRAAAKVLFGQSQPSGRLPVTLNDSFPEGSGLDGF
ncbi:MAG: glycoside hydrolase family 3 protein [Chloroflexota bacterium]